MWGRHVSLEASVVLGFYECFLLAKKNLGAPGRSAAQRHF